MFPIPTTIFASFFLFFHLFILTTLSQLVPSNLPPGPTVAECGPHLLPLAPCAPFVQGQSQSPALQCCDSLGQVYNQEPSCLCLFLNGTALSSLPINTTLALDLPRVCKLHFDASICSGVSAAPSSPPTSQASLGTNSSSSTTAAAPTAIVGAKPSTMRFGFGQSAGFRLESGGHLGLVVAAIIRLL